MAEESQRREARSLGWLTQSAVQPRKRKEIQGKGELYVDTMAA